MADKKITADIKITGDETQITDDVFRREKKKYKH